MPIAAIGAGRCETIITPERSWRITLGGNYWGYWYREPREYRIRYINSIYLYIYIYMSSASSRPLLETYTASSGCSIGPGTTAVV